jgi:hypothetical protein
MNNSIRAWSAASLLRAAALAAGLAMAGTAATAATPQSFSFGFGNIASVGEEGDPANVTLSFDIGRQSRVIGFSWDVAVTAFEPSWLSELTVSVANHRGEGFYFSPVLDLDESGSASSSGSVDLLNAGLAFSVLSRGTLNVEFFEFYDDLADAADGRWDRGEFSILYAPIPEPSSFALFAAGIAGVMLRRQALRAR